MVRGNVERRVVTRNVIVGISVKFNKEKKAESSHEMRTLKLNALHKEVKLTQMTVVTHRDLNRLPRCDFNVMRDTVGLSYHSK